MRTINHDGLTPNQHSPLIEQKLFAPIKGISATGLPVAIANPNSRHHDLAVRLASKVSETLTCQAVLAETAFHLHSVILTLALVREGLVMASLDLSDHLTLLIQLIPLRRYEALSGGYLPGLFQRTERQAQGYHHRCERVHPDLLAGCKFSMESPPLSTPMRRKLT